MDVFLQPEMWDAFLDGPYDVMWPESPLSPSFYVRPPEGGKAASMELLLQVKSLKEDLVTPHLRSEAVRIWKKVQANIDNHYDRDPSCLTKTRGMFLVLVLIRYNGTRSEAGYRLFPTCVAITDATLDAYNGGPVCKETREELETRFPERPTLLEASRWVFTLRYPFHSFIWPM